MDNQLALGKIRKSIAEAQNAFEEAVFLGHPSDPAWSIETAFLMTLSLVESLGLHKLHQMLLSDFRKIKNSKEGFSKDEQDEFTEEPYPVHLSKLRQYLHSIESFFPDDKDTIVSKDVLNILRDIHYTIADKTLFGCAPSSEKDVHLRIEGILKPLFPDLKHKPSLTKQIKNFEPDTGIPSIRTLIEYKYLDSKKSIPVLADQILADTRGYVSKEWNRFIYVVYETNRFRSEKDWNQLLAQSGLSDNSVVVVLSGEPSRKTARRRSQMS
ncbi:MAG: hypothetical protein V1799_00645 [bacterium]